MLTLNTKTVLGATPEARRFLVWRVTTFIVFGVMIGSLIGSSYLIYRTVYRTLQDAYVILTLDTTANLDSLNFSALEKTQALIERKKAVPELPAALRNIFAYGPATTTPYVPTTTRR